MIWQECDGTKSVTEISQVLSKQLKSNVSDEIVWLALNQFKADDLLETNDDFVTPMDGLSRREIVKRIGFASLVALPMISAVIAPTALHAQSGASNACAGQGGGAGAFLDGSFCTVNGDCCSGICAQGYCGTPTSIYNVEAAKCCPNFCNALARSGDGGRPIGATCTINGDCCSGICAQGLCGSPTSIPNINAASCCST